MAFIVDTNVLSELRKVRVGRADPYVTAWAEAIPPGSLFLSAVVAYELEVGVLLAERRDPLQGRMLRSWLDTYVLPNFTGRILPVDLTVARRTAALQVSDPKPVRDGLIAATALVHGMTVVTRNVADFRATGVAVLNPWDAAPPA